MRLGDLFPQAPPTLAALAIGGLTADSRAVAPGMVFLAVPGVKADGRRFAADAARRGAAAIVVEGDAPIEAGAVPVLVVADARLALAQAAARLHPRQPETIVAVTGTSGKTSVAEFTRQIFAALGHQAASLGTIGVVKPGGAIYGALTTPDPISLHRDLAALAAEGITHLAMESSSHGLDQKRLDGVRLAAGAFTNLRRDHLDYHPTVAAYLEAKLRLFTDLLPPGAGAVVNVDGEHAAEVLAAARARGLRVVSTGTGGATLRLAAVARDGFGQELTIAHSGREQSVRLPLVGDYQASNALVAAGLALATGESSDAAVSAIGTLAGVSGRLEIIGDVRGGIAVVDYAHKPDALEAALAALRPFVTGRLVCVFGCGGDRDRGKRPIMGGIAARLADLVIVTDDNPRSEQPAAIRAEILANAPGAREIGDRAEAIHAAVRMLGPGDVLLVAGKGHETGQIVGDRTLPFSDQDVVRRAMAEISA